MNCRKCFKKLNLSTDNYLRFHAWNEDDIDEVECQSCYFSGFTP